MKYALILSGEMRTYRHTIDSIKRFLPDADIYLHTWKTSKSSWKNKKRGLEYNKENVSSNDIIKIYGSQLKNYVIEDVFDIQQYYKGINNVKLLSKHKPNKKFYIDVHYQLYEAYKLLDKNYDLIIRSRPDVMILKRPEFIKPGIYTTSNPGGKNVGKKLNDFFAWGDQLSMEYYCTMFEVLQEYLTEELRPIEVIFKEYIQKNGVPLHEVEKHGEILRTENVIEDHISFNYYAR